MPDFIIIGAQKSGTSSLYNYLSQHPDIIHPITKEVHYFDGGLDPKVDNYQKGEAWYRAHFPLQSKLNYTFKTFEASPLYLYNPLTPRRISGLLPDIKIIVLLRNPTDRAISHYFHEVRGGKEKLPIWDALQVEEERLGPIIEKQDYKNNIFIHHSYKSRGLYHDQLVRYFKYFPRENILILNSEKFFKNTNETLKCIYRFVGIDQDFNLNDSTPRNVGKNKVSADPKVYDYLNDYFRNNNQKLYNLINQNYGWC